MSDKNKIDRRDFGKLLGGGMAAMLLPNSVKAQNKSAIKKAKPIKTGSNLDGDDEDSFNLE